MRWIRLTVVCALIAPAFFLGTARPHEQPKRPRVLILGDSISMGYTELVRKQLEGTADVFRPRENCQHTAYGLTRLETWLGDAKWDVIHFNWGIWDTHMVSDKGALISNEAKFDGVMHIRHTPEQYRANLVKLVEAMEKTGAKLIWASTTPIMSRTGKRFDDIKNFNAVAESVMKEHKVAINDLYTLVLPNAKEWQAGDKAHFNGLGNQNLARQVTASIRKVLGKEADDGEALLRKAVTLYASFDEQVRMDFGRGERTPGTRSVDPSDHKKFVFANGFDAKYFQIARGKGISGGCLQVVDLPPRGGRLFFPAKGNVSFQKDASWGGAFSVWVNTDPSRLLKTPFCDPVLITQKGFNNGSIWAHFNDAKPRALQAGTYPSIPDGQEPVPEDDPKAPLTRLKDVRFAAGEWHHLVLTWDRFNTGKKDATHTLWVDGKKIGELKEYAIGMDWDIERTRIYFAVNLVGLLDELAVFSRPLTADEVRLLYQKPGLLQSLEQAGGR